MKKRFKKLDAIAAALLVGTVGTMALAQAAPSSVSCPGGTTVVNGLTYSFGPITCPAGSECGIEIIIGMSGSVSVKGICIAPTPSPTPPTPAPR